MRISDRGCRDWTGGSSGPLIKIMFWCSLLVSLTLALNLQLTLQSCSTDEEAASGRDDQTGTNVLDWDDVVALHGQPLTQYPPAREASEPASGQPPSARSAVASGLGMTTRDNEEANVYLGLLTGRIVGNDRLSRPQKCIMALALSYFVLNCCAVLIVYCLITTMPQ